MGRGYTRSEARFCIPAQGGVRWVAAFMPSTEEQGGRGEARERIDGRWALGAEIFLGVLADLSVQRS